MARLLSEWPAEGAVAVTPDGRMWGPFGSPGGARGWERLFAEGYERLATAREVWEGTVPPGSAENLVSDFAVEFGLHPFAEVHDWFIEDDNGRPVADFAAGPRALDPDEAVLTGTADRGAPCRRLPDPEPPPPSMDLTSRPERIFPSSRGGEVVVAAVGSMLAVAWRPDGRVRRDLPVLSLHGVRECALKAAREAARSWTPPDRRRRSRPVDRHRSLAYRWEASLEAGGKTLGDIDACRDFAREVCEALAVPVPEITEGRADLLNHSHFSVARGIVLQKDMLDTRTVLHELAHHLVSLRGWGSGDGQREREPSHGPRFVGVLSGLLSEFAGVDVDDALRKADEAGLPADPQAAADVAEAMLAARAPGR